MQETRILDQIKPSEKVYNERGIAIGAFLGGPLAAGYLLVANYRKLGKGYLTGKTWIMTAGSCLVYFVLAYFIPDKVPSIVLPITCVAVARQVFKQVQEEDLKTHLSKEGEIYSSWRAAGIGTLFAILTLGLFFIGLMLFQPKEFAAMMNPEVRQVPIERPIEQSSSSSSITQSAVSSLETKSYGEAAHVIVYDELSFSETEINGIADELTALEFFDETNQKYVYLEKLLFDYEFSITDSSADMEDEETRAKYEKLRADMDAFLTDGKVILLLKDENLEEVLGRFGEEI